MGEGLGGSGVLGCRVYFQALSSGAAGVIITIIIRLLDTINQIFGFGGFRGFRAFWIQGPKP